MSDAEFWLLTLREYRYLAERHKEAEEREDRRFGRICALLYNANRKEGAEPLTEEDFIPKPPPPPQTPEQQLAILHTLGAMAQATYGGGQHEPNEPPQSGPAEEE